jgi:hypothetical protein
MNETQEDAELQHELENLMQVLGAIECLRGLEEEVARRESDGG